MATRRSKGKPAARGAPKRSSKKRARSGGRGRDKEGARILENLGTEESRQVVLALVARHPELASEVAELVEEIHGRTSFEHVADDVLEGLANLEIFDMSNRAGRQPFGYVDPSDAAAEMVEDLIEPYVDKIERCAASGLHEAALETCRGVLLGMYRAERSDASEVVQWIPEGLGEMADMPINALGSGKRGSGGRGGRRKLVPRGLKQFAKEHLPEWNWLHR